MRKRTNEQVTVECKCDFQKQIKLICRKTYVWTIEDGAATLEEPTSERNDVDEILYKRVAENDCSDNEVRHLKN